MFDYSQPVIEFAGSRGPQGSPGVAGATGPTGPTGPGGPLPGNSPGFLYNDGSGSLRWVPGDPFPALVP